MSGRADEAPRAGRTKLSFGVVFGVLFTFWTALAVCIAAIIITADDERDGNAAVLPTATGVAPTATALPEARPREVPLTATPLDGDYDSGEPRQHLFFHLGCTGGVLVIITTDERVYAETVCPDRIEPVYVNPFLGDPVRITVTEGHLEIVTADGARLTFEVERAWIDAR